MKKPLFIISSSIHITKSPLSYTPVRTVFTTEDRARQTIQTVQSVRTKMPEAKILFIETGQSNDIPQEIKTSVNAFLYLGEQKEMREAADSPYKGYGEAMSLYLADPYIRALDADYYFKLSGRYFLNDTFNPNIWEHDGYTAKLWYGVMNTVLYGFPKRLYDNWHDALKKSFPALLRGEALENALPREFNQTFYHLDPIGASGWISHSGEFCSL